MFLHIGPKISVIMPLLNDGPVLQACLTSLVPLSVAGLIGEVIVVDGGSNDFGPDMAKDFGANLINTKAGRGHQLAMGAQMAKHDWLFFIHADCVLEDGWVKSFTEILGDDAQMAYVGRLKFDGKGPGLARIALLANWRARILGLPYGDQGLLIGKSHYNQLGGFADLPLMEDVDFVRKIGRKHLKMLDNHILANPRRYLAKGTWGLPLRNLVILARYFLGADPHKLAQDYFR